MLSIEWFSTAMPFLTDIDIWEPGEEFLRDLFAKLDRTRHAGFLAHLQSLAFRGWNIDVDASVLPALSSRCTTSEESSKLESFRVIWWTDDHRPPDESIITALQALVERGMAIFVGHGDATESWLWSTSLQVVSVV